MAVRGGVVGVMKGVRLKGWGAGEEGALWVEDEAGTVEDELVLSAD